MFDTKGSRAMPAPARITADRAPQQKLSLERRSSRYVELIQTLDAGTGVAVDITGVIDQIEATFGIWCAIPLGLVAVCHLGPPYEVHMLDLAGGIVEHYAPGVPMPHPFENGRELAKHAAYVAVEIYTDRVACIREDGTVVSVVL